ncbi:hybrid sensor histidine kinase/response regulator transcription factor [Bacteroides sp.]|uniref:hybrid sensor histidine kinase/response regulator transcription factor n=1 Tax=Bacteroides sp. TaxID=29523 RepID=UPI003AB1D9A8
MKRLTCYILLSVLLIVPSWGQSSNAIENYIHISKKEGISHNNISAIHDDRYGRIWIGTFNGLDVYDSNQLMHIDRYSGMQIYSLFDDGREMFIATEQFLEVYDYETGRFTRIQENGWDISYAHAFSTLQAKDSIIILGNRSVYRYENRKVRLVKRDIPCARLVCDKYGTFWGLDDGRVHRMNENFDITKTYQLKNSDASLAKGLCIYADSRGIVWIGTIKDGLFKYNRADDCFQKESISIEYRNVELEDIASITEDEYDRLWIGFNYGISIYDYNNHQFKNYTFETKHNSLRNVAVTDIYQSKSHNMVIGSNFSGLFYIKELKSTERFFTLADSKENLGGITSNGIIKDKQSRIWVATNCKGISILDNEGHFIRRLDHTNSIISNNIISLETDSEGNIWAGGLSSGLYKIAPNDRITHYLHQPGDSTSLNGSFIQTLHTLNEDSMLVASNRGIEVFLCKKGIFGRLLYDSNKSDYNFYDIMWHGDKVYFVNTNSLFCFERSSGKLEEFPMNDSPYIKLQCGYVDRNGHVWVGTKKGELYSFENGKFELYINHKDIKGLSGIEGDAKGNLWLASGDNLFCVTPGKEVRPFYLDWGLDGNEFNIRSSYTDKDGCIYFGAAEKFLKFDPAQMVSRTHTPPVLHLSAFKLFNVPVEAGESSILKTHIDNTEKIVLENKQNFISFSVTCIDYNRDQPLVPYRIVYQLKNYDDNWYSVNPASNEISFTGLTTGTYLLNIRMETEKGDVLGSKTIEIKICLPLWLKPYMILLYIVLLGIVAYVVYSFLRKQRKAKELVMQSKREQAEMAKLNTMKLDFFTSISHEFQRPLDIISTLQNDLLPADAEPDSESNIFKRNVKRLQYLIDQLMDFRNIESQHTPVRIGKYDLVSFLNDIYETFTPLFRQKGVAHEFITDTDSLSVLFDSDKFEMLIGNLLSNAFEHTYSGGKCYLKITHRDEVIIIDVFNSGECLTEEQKTAIFQPYGNIQSENVYSNGGIGMSIVDSIVKLLNINLSVVTVENEGNIFRIEMPLCEDDNIETISPKIRIVNQIVDNTIYVEEQASFIGGGGKDGSLFQVLIVEDDADIKKILKKKLQNSYRVLLAANCGEALLILRSQSVDMVISSTAAQVCGLELCKAIKENEKTNHIPVLLVSSEFTPESKILAFRSGADAFVQKPINLQELQLRMSNMLKNKNVLRSYYSHLDRGNVKEQSLNNADEVFLKTLTDYVLSHLGDPELSIAQLSKHLNISRTLLYMNVKRIADQTPSAFILQMKMSQAHEMLLNTNLTVAEISDKLGYCNANHFSRQFKEFYNESPSKFRKQ